MSNNPNARQAMRLPYKKNTMPKCSVSQRRPTIENESARRNHIDARKPNQVLLRLVTKRLSCTVLCAAVSLLTVVPNARATSEYYYKPNEYVPIKHGRSPDNAW